MFSGSPFWGRWAEGAAYHQTALGVPTASTLKSICLAEQLLILRVHLPFVKGFRKIFFADGF